MEFERLQELYNLCNPDEPLSPKDARNVDIDKHGVRGQNWANKLAKTIELSKAPTCLLFTGLRGTGKSTEINRLMARLSDLKRKNLLTVLIDADDVLDLTVEIDISDLLSLVLLHTERAVVALEGGDAEEAMKDGPFRRLWGWLSKTDVEMSKASIGIDAGVKLGVDLNFKTNIKLRERVRNVVAEQPTTFINMVHEELRQLDLRARKANRGGIAVLFDSLEKLRGTSLTWREVLESAERIFTSGAPHLALPIHVLYTVPPALSRRMSTPVSFLPMIKVRNKEGVLYPEGVEVVSSLIAQRLGKDGMNEIFGEQTVAERVRAIALWSGGYPREIVRLLQSLLTIEDFPVSHEALEKELRYAGNTYRAIVYDSGAIPLLAMVNHTKKLIVSNDQDREAADRLLQNNVILRYLNDEEWMDVHPSVAGMKELAAPPEPPPPSLAEKA